jgi:itaconyl-CoA hydratase
MTLKTSWHGRYFEDFEVGDVYQHPLGRTLTEADNTWFSLLTMNTNQLHFNSAFAQRSPAGQLVVSSGLTVAIVLGQSVTDISQTAVFNLGWEAINLTHPVYVGDTLYAESIVLAKRPSRSRPYAGIIGCATRGLNQHGDECVSWRRSVLVYRRDAPQDKGYFPEARSGAMQLSDWADA